MKKVVIGVTMCLTSIVNYAQVGIDPVIEVSNVVRTTPDFGQGYLVMNETSGVDHWKVIVTKTTESGTLVVKEYESASGMDYVRLDEAHYINNDHSVRIIGVDALGQQVVLDDHDVAEANDPWALQPCQPRCNGDEYAWQIKVFQDPNGTNERLVLANTDTKYWQNIPAVNGNQMSQGFLDEAYERGIYPGVYGNMAGLEGIKWSGPHQVTQNQGGTYTPVYNATGNPIPVGDFYFKLIKDRGPWRNDNAGTNSISPNGGSFCTYNLSNLIGIFNNNSQAAANLSTPLACDGQMLAGTGSPAGEGSIPNNTAVAGEFVDCLWDLNPFDLAYDEENGWQPMTWTQYTQAMEDCYGNYSPSGTPFPGIQDIVVTDFAVPGEDDNTIRFVIGEGEDLELANIAEGLYVVNIHLADGSSNYVFKEKSASSSSATLDFNVYPNAVNAGDDFTVELNNQLTGSAQVVVLDMVTGATLTSGTVSNKNRFNGSIQNGEQMVVVRVTTATETATKILVVN